jgi:hypothetical protein
MTVVVMAGMTVVRMMIVGVMFSLRHEVRVKIGRLSFFCNNR